MLQSASGEFAVLSICMVLHMAAMLVYSAFSGGEDGMACFMQYMYRHGLVG